MLLTPDQFNAILNLVQTVLLAWIAAWAGRNGVSRESGRMQQNGRDTDEST